VTVTSGRRQLRAPIKLISRTDPDDHLVDADNRQIGMAPFGIGRPYYRGLAALGEPGVVAVFAVRQREFETNMHQVGATELKQIIAAKVTTAPAYHVGI